MEGALIIIKGVVDNKRLLTTKEITDPRPSCRLCINIYTNRGNFQARAQSQSINPFVFNSPFYPTLIDL